MKNKNDEFNPFHVLLGLLLRAGGVVAVIAAMIYFIFRN